jgi:hypothetical protein
MSEWSGGQESDSDSWTENEDICCAFRQMNPPCLFILIFMF